MLGKGIRNFVFVLLLVLLFMNSSARAVNYDEKIKETEQQKKEYEQKADEWQKELQQWEKDREDTLAYVEKIDKKMEKLEQSLAELSARIQKQNRELETIRQQFEQAHEEEQKQYITMKQRIKYMYENGNQGYWELLFGATSVSDFLNRSEYVEQISAYDKQVFERYRKIKRKVQEQEQKREKKIQELTDSQNQKRQEKEAAKQLKKKKKKELETFEKKLKKSEKKVAEYTRQVLQAEQEVEDLLREKQEEMDRQQGVGSGNSDSTIEKAGLIWPLRDGAGHLSSVFGPRRRPTAGASTYHKGIDLGIAYGTPILAAGSGTVVTSRYSSSAGNFIMISHGSRLYTVYMHCSRLAVKVGESVTKGQVIGYVGSTGISTGAHLHFGVSKNGSYVNPLMYVSR